MPVREARKILIDQESESLMDKDAIREEAVRLAEGTGMIFLDEMDKICGAEETRGADVSRQGVQRDLLPIVEGTTVQTRYGPVNTEHMLFIAAGAFHRSKPSDLMPELQGRFPIRVELTDLSRDDFVRILTEPAGSLTKQYAALLAADGVTVRFETDGIDALADVAHRVNQTTQNIGARRLHTILERLLEDVSYEAPETAQKTLVINADYVKQKLESIMRDEDLSRFVL
jgi:ATP-dependent HslUV protease ATP-binding subunit HslU